jgi:4-amino-4-deoxy-L-arabinose transferase-like glycosyltransferase
VSIEEFYATFAQVSFTLLGFWWAVVQFRHSEWMRRPRYRRMAHSVSLLFLLPGIMAIISTLASNVAILWRLTFGLAGLLGIVSATLILTTALKESSRRRLLVASQIAALVLYSLVVLVAVRPELVREDLALVMTPREVEGVLLSLLVLLGVNLAWLFFTEPPHEQGTEA